MYVITKVSREGTAVSESKLILISVDQD